MLSPVRKIIIPKHDVYLVMKKREANKLLELLRIHSVADPELASLYERLNAKLDKK